MSLRVCFVVFLIAWKSIAFAEGPAITISTNNTPMDRKVLQSVSEEAFRRSGAEFKVVSLPSERSLRAANLGEVDGEGLRIGGLSKNYPNLIQIPEPYTRISFVAFSKHTAINIAGWESLKSYRVAFITGWKIFEANATKAKIINKVDRPEQLFLMLERDRIDIALYTLADGLALVRKMGLSSVVPLNPPLKELDLYLYLHKKHEALIPSVTSAIRDMKKDGTYSKIVSAIFGK